MSGRQEFNGQIIADFHANGGVLRSPLARESGLAGADILILHTRGAKTALPRVVPLTYLPDGADFIVFASRGGSPHHPSWFHNLCADPTATVEVGTATMSCRAVLLAGEDRERVWAEMKRRRPRFAEYEQKTAREIPAVRLEVQS